MSPVFTYSPELMEKYDVADFGMHREAPSLTHRSLFLKQESNNWDPEDNKIVQVTRKMADIICHMTQYLRKKGPIPNKDAFVAAAKDVISNCESVTQFISVIANHCLDKQCTIELSLIVEQILTITNQLSIISSVNAVTPGSKSSDEILVKNAQNLLQTVLKGVHAAESACITGLKQPEPNTECAEATALCFQWRRNLEMHRAQQTSNLETDDLGLRKTSAHHEAPSLAPAVNVQDNYK
ncbi:vinculin [Eucyclogobius newberryi]|uniref:vinculin n=1 Tax=Eucyclogobius newberryi TaxID=166745 RepID=UPI003B5B47AE